MDFCRNLYLRMDNLCIESKEKVERKENRIEKKIKINQLHPGWKDIYQTKRHKGLKFSNTFY